MADGLYESYIRSFSISRDGQGWARHGEVSAASMLDGYTIRKLASPTSSAPIFAESGGWLWNATSTGFALFREAHWTNRPVEALDGKVAVIPGERGRALVLLPDRLMEYDLVRDTSVPVWLGGRSLIGTFTDVTGDLNTGLWISGTRGVGRLRRAATPGGLPEWTEFHDWPSGLHDFRNLSLGAAGEVFVSAALTGHPAARALARFDGRGWSSIYRSQGNDCSAWRGFDDRIWIRDGNDLYWLDRGQIRRVERRGPLSI